MCLWLLFGLVCLYWMDIKVICWFTCTGLWSQLVYKLLIFIITWIQNRVDQLNLGYAIGPLGYMRHVIKALLLCFWLLALDVRQKLLDFLWSKGFDIKSSNGRWIILKPKYILTRLIYLLVHFVFKNRVQHPVHFLYILVLELPFKARVWQYRGFYDFHCVSRLNIVIVLMSL